MKSKDLIYYASAAVLLAFSAQTASADELTVADQASPENSQLLAAPAPSAVGQAEQASPAAAVPAPQTAQAEPAVQSLPAVQPAESPAAASGQTDPAGLSSGDPAPALPIAPAQSQAAPGGQKEEPAAPAAESGAQQEGQTGQQADSESANGQVSFFNTGANAPASRSTDVAVQPKSFIDVSSHNGYISLEDYRTLVSKGVGGVVVKLTEGTSYTNPFAQGQVRNAQSAGLQVSAYAYSHYRTEEEARAEARYFIAAAKGLSLPTTTVMVNDMEESGMQANINRNTQAWVDEMRKNGYSNLVYYTSASWLDENNLRSKGPVKTSQFGLENFWVAQYPAPKLSVSDAKSLRYNGRAGAWQFTSQAELLPGKHVFDQSVDYTGRFTANAKPVADLTRGPLKGTISIENKDSLKGLFDVVISNVTAPHGVASVSVPVWSDKDGQDDLVWYAGTRQANGSYKVSVKASDHKNSSGLYHVHLYYNQLNGQQIGVTSTTTELIIGRQSSQEKPKGSLTIENKNDKTGSFDAVIRNVTAPNGLKEVLVPTWSVVNGQDDLVWHKANRQADGSYKATISASQHKNSTGRYDVHVYYLDGDNKKVFVTGTSTRVSYSRPTGSLSIENKNDATGSFDAVIRNVSASNGLKEVLVPTWSVINGQDDLVWHKASRQADGSYKASISASQHKNSTGRYDVHVYYLDGDNNKVFVTGSSTTVSYSRPTGSLSIENKNDATGSFDAVIRNVSAPNGLKEVLVPTWSVVNGQDDLVWHKASRQADGSYKATISASQHKNSTGRYDVHVYYLDGADKKVFVTGTSTQVNLTQPSGSVTVVNNNKDTGHFDVLISNVYSPKGVQLVQVPIWSDKDGQDDLIWYNGTRQTDGSYKVSVKASDHKNTTGLYNIHLYYIQNDGSRVGVAATTTQVEYRDLTSKTRVAITNVNANAGSFVITVDQAPQGRKVETVRAAVWSRPNQENLYWYTAPSGGSHTEIRVSASNHGSARGDYTTHVYVNYSDGSVEGFNLGQTALTPQRLEPQTTYYSQRDPRWASRYYGISNIDQAGCVPTVLAMAIGDIKGGSVTPVDVADYLFNNTDSFNKSEIGTSADGIPAAASHWGLTTQALGGAAGVREALSAGRHVLAAVGNSQFVAAPLTHELLLQGFDNGRTYVRDPYNPSNNGWYSLDYLHGIQSRDPIDLKLGSPFISIFA